MIGFIRLRQQINSLDYRSWTMVLRVLKQLEDYIREARGRQPQTIKPKPQPQPSQLKGKKDKNPPQPPKPKYIPGRPRDPAALEEALDILNDWDRSINTKLLGQVEQVVRTNLGRTKAAVRQFLAIL